MRLDEFLMLIMMFMVFGVLIVGLTARFAAKPIVDSIIRLREAFMATASTSASNDTQEIRLLRQELQEFRTRLDHIEHVVDFERALGKTTKADLPLSRQ
ncbi:MAG TPA: hypothetical protein VM100_13185 [Longimicrobiales bacterium]|nr:hypothetical protein [Longimicrobiales bacterium]